MEEISVTLRPMQLNDVEAGMRLSTAESWNQTGKDWKFLIENPYNICLVAEANDKVIGTTTAINYSNEVAWIGMVLVDKNYRRRGISRLLLTNILEKLQSFKSLKLDATQAGQQVYKKLGFTDEYSIIRMINPTLQHFSMNAEKNISWERIQSNQIENIAAFDENVFGANRIQLIKYLIKEYSHKACLRKRNNVVAGFALGRDGNKFHHVGPVMASTVKDAKMLISKALGNLNNHAVVVDVLNDKAVLINWLQSIGFIKQREFVRMYKKENCFAGEIGKHFLICGPEFG